MCILRLHHLQSDTAAWHLGRAGLNGSDIEVLRQLTISVSNFQSIKVSTDDRIVHLELYSWIAGLDSEGLDRVGRE